MKDHIEERYIFYWLAMVDMDRVLKCISYIESLEDDFLKDAMVRDAVVSYMRPFSGNEGIHQRKGLKVPTSSIPANLKSQHTEIETYRQKLFAHMDISFQSPKLECYEINGKKHYSFTTKGYERTHVQHLVKPLGKLAKIVRSYLMKELNKIEQKHF